MKQLLPLALAVAAASPAMAQLNNITSPHINPRLNLDKAQVVSRDFYPKAEAATRYDDSDPVIYDPPQGETRWYSRDAQSYMFLETFNFLLYWRDFAMATPMVFTDDNKVYLRKPVSAYNSGWGAKPTWIEGYIQDDKLVFPLPQMIENIYGDVTMCYALDLEYKYDEDGVVNGVNCTAGDKYQVTFSISNDGKTFIKDDPSVIIGITDQMGTWQGFGDHNVSMNLFEDEQFVAPEGLTYRKWRLDWLDSKAERQTEVLDVAVDGENVYIKGISPQHGPTTVIRATLKGDKLIFNTQYMEEVDEYYNYFVVGGYEVNPDDGKKYPYIAKNLTLTLDAETSSFTAPALFAVGPGIQLYNPQEFYRDPVFTMNIDAQMKAEAPAKPVFVEYVPYDTEMGEGNAAVAFKLPFIGETGNILDKRNIYYNIWIDDELQVFEPEDFLALKEPMTNIPYTYSDNLNFFIDNLVHMVYFPYTIGKVAVQSVYVDEEGNEYKSEVAECNGPDDVWKDEEEDPSESGISNATAEGEVSVAYTDLAGNRVSNPSKGLYIRTATMSDGRAVTSKVILK